MPIAQRMLISNGSSRSHGSLVAVTQLIISQIRIIDNPQAILFAFSQNKSIIWGLML